MYQTAKYPPILKRAIILNDELSSPPLIAMLLLTSVSAEEVVVTSNADLDDCTDDDDDDAVVARTIGFKSNGACLVAEAVVASSRATARMVGERMTILKRRI